MKFCERLDFLWISDKKRWVALVAALVDNFIFGSFFYGYNALLEPYGEVGVFESYCPKVTVCEQRERLFNYAYVTGVISQLCLAPLTGLMMDRIGLRTTKLISVLLFFTGTVLFAFTSAETSFMIFPAMILVAVGSFASLFCNINIGSLFNRIQGLVIALISGAFDSSLAVAFIVSKAVPLLSLQISFLILAGASLLYGTMMSLLFLAHTEAAMIPIKMVAVDAMEPASSISQLSQDSTVSELLINADEEIARVIQKRYPNLKSCILSLPFLIINFVYTPGILRYSFVAAQLVTQLEYAFPNDRVTIKELLQASAAIGMCGFLISPVTGLTLDMARQRLIKKLSTKLNDPSKYLDDGQIYWTYLRSLAPAFTLHALLAILISGAFFIREQVWVYYVVFFINMLLTSVLSSAVTAAVIYAFPLIHFGTLMGLVTCCGGLFSTVQFGLLRLPTPITNSILMGVSVFLLIPPLMLLCKQH